ncbi:MAG TPA: hypothetical protein VGR02_12080 [Thermoanaerobaculia bacterium]|jgi:hypothetical protein|nr:hypothetical protein [Thermoanaerobaculia bacterium]
MKRLLILIALTTSAFAQKHPATATNFASDLQTVAVMANTSGVGGAQFQTAVSIFNPTASAFAVTASLYDAAGVKHDATIQLAAGELKTYANFLDEVFHFAGGGAVVFQSATSANRFIVSSDIRTGRYSTSVPVSDFAGSSSRSFAAGVTVDSNSRTNVGCLNQSGSANSVKVTIYDNSGQQVLGTQTLSLLPNAWAQAGVTAIVNGGYVQFDPSDAALCYAVVVDNSTNDGRFVPAAEYQP